MVTARGVISGEHHSLPLGDQHFLPAHRCGATELTRKGEGVEGSVALQRKRASNTEPSEDAGHSIQIKEEGVTLGN